MTEKPTKTPKPRQSKPPVQVDPLADMNFTLKYKQRKVTIVSKDGTPINCILREMSGIDRDNNMQDLNGRMITKPNGDTGLSTMINLQAGLVQKCLFKTSQDGLEKFDLEEIQEFPATVLEALHDAAQALNGLDKDANETAKKD